MAGFSLKLISLTMLLATVPLATVPIIFATIGCANAKAHNEHSQKTSEDQVASLDPAKILKLQRKTIRDPGSKNIESHALLVPQGWSLKGQTKWAAIKYYRILPGPVFSISSPAGVEVSVAAAMAYSDPKPMAHISLPRPKEGTSDAGYPVKYLPESESAWIKEIKDRLIPKQYPKAEKIRVTNVTNLPELSQVLEKNNKPILEMVNAQNRQAAILGMPPNIKATFSSMAFESEYVEDGVEMEELRIVGVFSKKSKLPGIIQINWIMWPHVCYRAPKGKLEKNLTLLIALGASIRPTKEWSDHLFDHVSKMRRIDRKSFDEQNRLIRKTFSEINRIRRSSDEFHDKTRAEIHRKVINCIRGTSDYAHQGDEYQLPAGYEHVYTDGFDSIILTNNALFDPNTELGTENWHRMKLVR